MVLKLNEVPSIFPEAQRAGEGFDSDIIWSDVGYGIVPIGGIVAWCKTLVFGTSAALLIPNFLECNGQVVADGGSPLDGMTLPDLTGGQFLKGAAASGTITAAVGHTHTVPASSASWGTLGTVLAECLKLSSGGESCCTVDRSTSSAAAADPPNMTVVWVIRIK
jgi:hypothetical protein